MIPKINKKVAREKARRAAGDMTLPTAEKLPLSPTNAVSWLGS
jgi:hypothetical protein